LRVLLRKRLDRGGELCDPGLRLSGDAEAAEVRGATEVDERTLRLRLQLGGISLTLSVEEVLVLGDERVDRYLANSVHSPMIGRGPDCGAGGGGSAGPVMVPPCAWEIRFNAHR